MHISLAAESIGHILGLPITNSLVMAWVTIVFLAILSYFGTRQMQAVPTGLQNFLEIIIEWMHNLVRGVFDSSKQAYQYLPFVGAFFIFIVTANWLGLIPGVGTIGFHEMLNGQQVMVPLLRSANADLNLTLAMAMV